MMGDDVDEVKIVMMGDDVGISNDLVLLKAVIVVIKIMIKNMMMMIATTITMTIVTMTTIIITTMTTTITIIRPITCSSIAHGSTDLHPIVAIQIHCLRQQSIL